MIQKLFIANRSEIACRIAKTARKMDIATCGVFTPADAHCRHVRELDQLHELPAGPLSENYLNQDLLIRIALQFGADALHPGYGFLSENSSFAEAVLHAGLIWVGPKPDSMRKLGGKTEAKLVAAAVKVPVIPWTTLDSAADGKKIARKIGLPFLIKAAHGGGGRGQRVVSDVSQFEESLRAARSEAQRSFGSDDVFVEKYLEHPRHIEVQLMGDQHGNLYAFGERDCTLQRRNQKLIEETPAATLDQQTREKIISAALSLGHAADYSNAGTIEFLAQKKESGGWEFFFMELNARLQVEHPVTEMVWNVDLVELQIRAAQDEAIMEFPWKPSGHAIEVRLCAEDPARNFLPTPGPVTQFSIPGCENVRVDAGFEEGDVIAAEYDSLFAKLICCGSDRTAALALATNTLEESMIAGIITNKHFLHDVLEHADFQSNTIDTRWIASHKELTAHQSDALDRDLLYWGKKWSSELFVQREPSDFSSGDPCEILCDFEPAAAHGELTPQGLIRIAGHFRIGEECRNFASGWITRVELCISFQKEVEGVGQRLVRFAGRHDVDEFRAHHGPIVAQVPGVVLDVRAKVNELIGAQTPILVIEAMKIEMPVSLPVPSKITAIHVKRGDRISPGQTLVTWEPVESEGRLEAGVTNR